MAGQRAELAENITLAHTHTHMEYQSKYTIFRDCISSSIVQKLLLDSVKKPLPTRAKGRKNSAAKADNAETSNDANDQEAADDYADFVDVVIS